ncbi:ThiF family adenylyltransferase [Pseudomonas sp.]|uniref:ThiF family adenylyltransferase n=1 Tax=Pseudomonas sp. TaxID=306 RepID=UPI00258FC7AB|nr:ThiF family adenylyltransferase [Pseudomonas sp.]
MFYLNSDIIIKNDKTILLTGKKSFTIAKPTKLISTLIHALHSGIKDTDFHRLANEGTLAIAFAKLRGFDLIIQIPDNAANHFIRKSELFLARTFETPENTRSKISKIHVTVLGCGGIGANLTYHLAMSGFRKFTFIDCDAIEASNINRQYPFTPNDVGNLKTEQLENFVRAVHPDAETRSISARIKTIDDLNNLLPTTNLIICGADTPPILIKKIVALFARINEVDVAFCGVGYEEISIGPLLTSHAAKTNYIASLEKLDKSVNYLLLNPCRGSLGATNSMATSTLAAQLIYHYCALAPSTIKNKELLINPWSLSLIRKIAYDEY